MLSDHLIYIHTTLYISPLDAAEDISFCYILLSLMWETSNKLYSLYIIRETTGTKKEGKKESLKNRPHDCKLSML
jgi:hypothetical protein